jgi:hypothetical protein
VLVGNLAAVDALLKLGAHPEGPPRIGDRPLWLAIRHRKPEIVELLLLWGAQFGPLEQQRWRSMSIDWQRRRSAVYQSIHRGQAARTSLLNSVVDTDLSSV